MASAILNPLGSLTNAWSAVTSRIYLLTWNVNGKPPPDDVTDLLKLNALHLPEIYAIGLQEATSHDWEGVFTIALGRHGFVKIKSRRLLGIVTVVYVKRTHLNYVTSIESEVTKTGLRGYWGNKGASSVRMDFMGMNLIIVNSHLAAHMEEVMQRMIHVDAIIDDQKFRDPDVESIMDHDYIFWIGDLNFRTEDISFNRTMDLIRDQDYRTLVASDQLHMVMEEGLVFENFREGDINFPPTYKFDIGTDHYDTSDKQRIPSYTDRILYHYHETSYGEVNLRTRILSYDCHPNFRLSDHKPVSALLEINVLAKGVTNPVAFEEYFIPWRVHRNMDITYVVRRNFCICTGDWIGIYKADFLDFDSYVTYIWASTTPFSSSSSHSTLKAKFDASQLSNLEQGFYVLCYMTRKYSLCGISKEFLIG